MTAPAAAAATATVLVVNYEGETLLGPCLDALRGQGAARVVVVDNASCDGSLALLRAREDVDVIASPTNLGYAGAIDLVLGSVATPYLVVLNTDTEVAPGWLDALVAPFADAAVAATSSRLVLPDGRLQSTGGGFDPAGYGRDRGFGQPDDGRDADDPDVAYACGAAMGLRVDAVRAVGGTDPRFFMYYEDAELCWRLRLAGHAVRYAPDALVVHQHSATVGAGSLFHTRWTERNRLATLVTCATPGRIVRQFLRYPLTTVSVALFESRPKAVQRIVAYGSVLRALPGLVRRRRALPLVVPRAEFEARWLREVPR